MSVEAEGPHGQLVEIVVQEFEVDPVTGMTAVVYTEDQESAMMIEQGNAEEEDADAAKQIARKEDISAQTDGDNASGGVEAGPWVVKLCPDKADGPESKKKSRRIPSEVWSHFKKIDNVRARCESCNKILAHCRNTTNLKNHLESCAGDKWKTVPRPTMNKLKSADKPLKKRRLPSEVWNHFEKIDKQRARCSICDKLIAHSGNTSNLRQHLEVVHKKKRDDVCEFPRTSMAVSISSKHNMSAGSTEKMLFESEMLRTKLFQFYLQRFFVENCLPFDMVESKSFLDLVRLLDKRVKVPDTRTLISRVDELYAILKQAYVSEIEQLDSVSLSCETWSDSVSAVSYLAVTVHFMNENSLDSITIGTRQITETDSSKVLETVIRDVLNNWQIPKHKISACATNGTIQVLEAVDSFVTSDCHLNCFACNLNVVVSDAIEKTLSVKAALEKVKSIVMLFKRNEKAAEQLQKEQVAQHEVPLKLVQGCSSKWVSVCEMLDRYLKLEMFLAKAILSDLSLDVDFPTKHERDMLLECTKLLSPFFEAAKEISTEKYVSASKILPICKILNLAVDSIDVTFEPAVSLKEHLLENMRTQLQPLEDVQLLNICTILDPRFKTRPISNQLMKSKALQTINNEMQETQSSLNRIEDARNGNANDASNITKNIWDFYNELPFKSKNSKDSSSYKDELTQYLNAPPVERHVSPLQFWNNHKQSYTSLYLTARKYLSVVGNSVPSECLFSKAGMANTEKRNRLPQKHAEKLLFLCSLSESRWNAVAI